MTAVRRHGGLRVAGVIAVAWGFAAPTAVPVGAQERTPVRLGVPLAVHPEPFALVSTVRELGDGSVMVADPLGQTLVRLSPDLGAATVLGREGEGPDEYQQPDAVWPLPGDSTLLVDLGNARLTVVSPAGSFGRTRPLMLAPFQPGRGTLSMLMPRGVDARGRIYFEGARQGPGGVLLDSIPVLRLDPATDRVDTLARVRAPAMSTTSSGSANNQQVRVTPIPLATADGWAVDDDGAVAVVREGEYRVDWFRDGRVTRGDPVDVEPVPIGRAEREEWADNQQRSGGIGVAVAVENGQVSVSMGRRSGERPDDLTSLPWPDAKPPFVASGVRADGLGRVWVERSQPAGRDALYDMFGPDGGHVASVRFPPGRRLVGFGDGVLYAVQVGEFDLLTLERYALPAIGAP